MPVPAPSRDKSRASRKWRIISRDCPCALLLEVSLEVSRHRRQLPVEADVDYAPHRELGELMGGKQVVREQVADLEPLSQQLIRRGDYVWTSTPRSK